MIQLFFFISLLSIGALALNFIWYINDTYDEEKKSIDRIYKSDKYQKKYYKVKIKSSSGYKPEFFRFEEDGDIQQDRKDSCA